MTSVLYYIYNGEVIVQKDKIEMFLDIVKAMQIFVDGQYLPQMSDTLEYNNFDVSFHFETDLSKRNVFTLGFEDCRDQRYVNIKKGKAFQDVLQYSVSNADCKDKLVRSQNPSGERKSSLGNLKSPHGNRQRNSFLRDLFIETYPQNGNVNGLTAGVLAISNECYRAPASVLLTNANGKHLSADGSLLEPYKKTNEHISHSPKVFHLRKQQRCTRDEPDYGETNKMYDQSCLKICSTEKSIKTHAFDTDTNNLPMNILMNHVPMSANPLVQLGIPEQILSRFYVPSLDFSIAPSMFNAIKPMPVHRNRAVIDNASDESRKEIDVTTSARVTILNHVLESPWSPRIPTNYKPFRRKTETPLHCPLFKQKVSILWFGCVLSWTRYIYTKIYKKYFNFQAANENKIVNDSNNNVPKPTLQSTPDAVSATATASNDSKKLSIVACVPDSRRDDFKCTICNQVNYKYY